MQSAPWIVCTTHQWQSLSHLGPEDLSSCPTPCTRHTECTGMCDNTTASTSFSSCAVARPTEARGETARGRRTSSPSRRSVEVVAAGRGTQRSIAETHNRAFGCSQIQMPPLTPARDLAVTAFEPSAISSAIQALCAREGLDLANNCPLSPRDSHRACHCTGSTVHATPRQDWPPWPPWL
jgi:hypothetical protein